MIEYIKGELTEITPALAVIECNGVGYGVNVSLNTYSAIQGKKRRKVIHLRGNQGGCVRVIRLCLEAGARIVSAAHHRFGHRRKHGAHDTLGSFAVGAMQRYQQRKREIA